LSSANVFLRIRIMPIYEFQCQSCGSKVEVLQKMSDAPLTDCDACGESSMKKMVSAAAFRLSGSGWYETDFKSGEKKNLTNKDESKPKTTAKSTKKTDSEKKSKTTKTSKAE